MLPIDLNAVELDILVRALFYRLHYWKEVLYNDEDASLLITAKFEIDYLQDILNKFRDVQLII